MGAQGFDVGGAVRRVGWGGGGECGAGCSCGSRGLFGGLGSGVLHPVCDGGARAASGRQI